MAWGAWGALVLKAAGVTGDAASTEGNQRAEMAALSTTVKAELAVALACVLRLCVRPGSRHHASPQGYTLTLTPPSDAEGSRDGWIWDVFGTCVCNVASTLWFAARLHMYTVIEPYNTEKTKLCG